VLVVVLENEMKCICNLLITFGKVWKIKYYFFLNDDLKFFCHAFMNHPVYPKVILKSKETNEIISIQSTGILQVQI